LPALRELKKVLSLKWVFAETPDPEAVRLLTDQTELPPEIVRILINRRLVSTELINRFVNPDMSDLFDPFELEGIEQAVTRIIRALRDQERIMVYGDYDVDGITSAALTFLVLNRLGADVSYYLPNRLVEGYGLSEDGIQEAINRKISLIITVDCGVTAINEVEYARGKGIDVIITDHHEPGQNLPNAVSIVNPKLNAAMPGQELAGVGVAFKLAQALYRSLGQNDAELEEHLDLVAMGTAADIAPLIGENRILTKHGIRQIARTNKPGLKSLCFVSGLMGKEITSGQVVFILAPRINAVGRLGDPELAIRLLTTRDDIAATKIARKLDEENKLRKKLDETTLRQALELVKSECDPENDPVIVLAAEGWHQGVIGIVASRIVERYHVPTVLIAIDGKEGKGSARSIPSFHLYNAMRECEDLLLRYGGHKYAAGLSIATDKIPEFRERLKKVARGMLSDEDLTPTLTIDCYMDLDRLDEDFIRRLEEFAPFGPQNTRPVFMTGSVELVGTPYIVGRNHLKFRAGKGNSRVFDCIGFNMGDIARRLSAHAGTIDMAYVAERVWWNNAHQLQLRIKDIQLN
jgi:single-stranded-DNA-specific exonuclease